MDVHSDLLNFSFESVTHEGQVQFQQYYFDAIYGFIDCFLVFFDVEDHSGTWRRTDDKKKFIDIQVSLF